MTSFQTAEVGELGFSFYTIRVGGEITKGQKEKEQDSPRLPWPCGEGEMRLRLVSDVPRFLIGK